MKRAKGTGPKLSISVAIFSAASFNWCADLASRTQTILKLMAKIDAFFNLMFEQKASDLHLSSGNNPMLRINGDLQRVDFPPLENDALKTMLYEIAPEYK